jgi:hypothetical protein
VLVKEGAARAIDNLVYPLFRQCAEEIRRVELRSTSHDAFMKLCSPANNLRLDRLRQRDEPLGYPECIAEGNVKQAVAGPSTAAAALHPARVFSPNTGKPGIETTRQPRVAFQQSRAARILIGTLHGPVCRSIPASDEFAEGAGYAAALKVP